LLELHRAAQRATLSRPADKFLKSGEPLIPSAAGHLANLSVNCQ
jgi:hypothetical protein